MRAEVKVMKKSLFVPPEVLQKVSLELEDQILAGSVADSTSVQTTGQEVDSYDFSQTAFNHTWED
jgi:hypothetical protein